MSFEAQPSSSNVVALHEAPLSEAHGWENDSSLTHALKPLRALLDNPQVTEVCVNRPQEAFVQTYTGWDRLNLPFADFDWCRDFAKLVGSATKQRIDEVSPILSATLPTGERVQFVLPPATLAHHVSVTIRRPSTRVRTLDELARGGLFKECLDSTQDLDHRGVRKYRYRQNHDDKRAVDGSP
jgi:type IV secretion system protein VirB11